MPLRLLLDRHFVVNELEKCCLWFAVPLRTVCQNATNALRNIYIYFVKYSHSTTKYISTDLQQHNIQKAKTILLQCKNPLFVRQKPYFYTVKTILLFFVSITNTLLMCYEYSMKWLRTFHEMPTKHSARRRDRFIAPVSLHYQIHIFVSPNTYLTIIEYTYSFHHTRVFTLSNMRFHSSFCGCLRICGHDKSDPYSC